jgi:serine/threonine protein kinase
LAPYHLIEIVFYQADMSFLDALPPHLRIDEVTLVIGAVLGHGSFGVVNKGVFNGQAVCIKVGRCLNVGLSLGVVVTGKRVVCGQSMHALNDPELYGLAPGSAEEKAVINDLVAEVTMLATLHCDKIVSFRGVCIDSATIRPKYIVLELASGSLEWYLKSLRDALPLSRFVGICEDILTGLEYLHSRLPPIMHRDLKPANVLVFLSISGSLTCKIGDVGLARFAATNTASKHGTVGAGTLYYMAPEVMFGEYNHAVDIFSFGIMMAEIVVSKMKSPPTRTGDMSTRMKMVSEATTFLKPFSNELAGLVEGCCRTDVSTRLTARGSLELLHTAATAVMVGAVVCCVTRQLTPNGLYCP